MSLTSELSKVSPDYEIHCPTHNCHFWHPFWIFAIFWILPALWRFFANCAKFAIFAKIATLFRLNRHSPRSQFWHPIWIAITQAFFLPFFPFSPLLDILDATQILLLIIDRYVLHYLCVTEYDTLFISDTTKAVRKRLAKQIKLTQNSNEDIPSNWISNPIISSTPVGPFILVSTDIQRKCDISVIRYFYPGDIWRRFTNSYTVQIQGSYIFANNNRLIPGDVGDAWWLYKINLITVNQNCHYR